MSGAPNKSLQATSGRVSFQSRLPPGRTRLSLVVRPLASIAAAEGVLFAIR
jgi:hypothetical protein